MLSDILDILDILDIVSLMTNNLNAAKMENNMMHHKKLIYRPECSFTTSVIFLLSWSGKI